MKNVNKIKKKIEDMTKKTEELIEEIQARDLNWTTRNSIIGRIKYKQKKADNPSATVHKNRRERKKIISIEKE